MGLLMAGCDNGSPASPPSPPQPPQPPPALTFTVTFNSAGGSAVAHQSGIEDGALATEPPPPTRGPAPGLWTGTPQPHTFNGWHLGGAPFSFSTPITANITLTAQWAAPTATPISTVAANNISAAVLHANSNHASSPFTLLLSDDVTVINVLTIAAGAHLTVVGTDGRRMITRTGNGTIFTLNGANRSLTLGDNITLAGHGGNNAPLVLVQGGASLTMNNGAQITGNTASGNTQAGGVVVTGASVFMMNGGVISGNASTGTLSGGGVRIAGSASFRMYGGYIENNEARVAFSAIGGGVFLDGEASTFTMLGGTILSNRAPYSSFGAGGVGINSGALRIVSGVIYGSAGMGNANESIGQATLRLGVGAMAHRGTLTGGNWNTASAVELVPGFGSRGTHSTIRVVNGVLQ